MNLRNLQMRQLLIKVEDFRELIKTFCSFKVLCCTVLLKVREEFDAIISQFLSQLVSQMLTTSLIFQLLLICLLEKHWQGLKKWPILNRLAQSSRQPSPICAKHAKELLSVSVENNSNFLKICSI
jgi:hypothetical protein